MAKDERRNKKTLEIHRGIMKRILISIRDLNIGGVQKSLVELLKAFNQEIDSEKIQIDLLCLNSNGILKNEINPKVKIIVPNNTLIYFVY